MANHSSTLGSASPAASGMTVVRGACLIGICAFIFAFITPAHAAEMFCAFTHECHDLDACEETNFDVWFDLPDEETDTVLKSSAEEIVVKFSQSEDEAVTVLRADRDGGEQHLLTIVNGRSRYSVHMPSADLALFYMGTCSQKD